MSILIIHLVHASYSETGDLSAAYSAGKPVRVRIVSINTESRFITASILKAIDGRAPVHLVWTREDDMRGGYYRPMVYHRVRAGLDANGRIAGWEHRIVGKSVLLGSPFEAMVKDGVDATSVEGVADTSYAIPDLLLRVFNIGFKSELGDNRTEPL